MPFAGRLRVRVEAELVADFLGGCGCGALVAVVCVVPIGEDEVRTSGCQAPQPCRLVSDELGPSQSTRSLVADVLQLEPDEVLILVLRPGDLIGDREAIARVGPVACRGEHENE